MTLFLSEPIHPSSASNIFDYTLYFFIALAIMIFIIVFFSARKELTNHWNYLIQGLSYSTQDYYSKLETLLKEQGIENIQLKTKNINIGGVGSQKRLYLNIQWKEFTYEVCSAPFGNSYFISYWAFQKPNKLKQAISKIPLIGFLLVKLFAPETYYKIDTRNMFHSLVHQCVTDIADEISKENNIEVMNSTQKVPQMKDVFKR